MGIPYAEVIGDPIAHSKSPLIHRFWLEKLAIEGDYRAIRVTAEELPAYLESRRADPDWRGCNVAMPLKEEAWRLVDHVDSPTRRIGALNTIIRHAGDPGGLGGANTDWIGLNLALDTERLRPERAAIIGTGGAARAAMEELRRAKVRHVTLVSRSIDKAAKLLGDFDLAGNVLPLGSAPHADLLVNASPIGMAGFPSVAVDLGNLSPKAMVVDMVYAPLVTPLLKAARVRGLETIDGLTMLIHQAAMAFTYFFKDSPEPADTPELRKLLVS
jgi:shikimate dehydrogenase